METTLFILAMLALAFLALFVVPRWRMKRANRQVIETFRHHGAVTSKSAKPIEELGLKPRGLLEGMFRGRDYKPYALQMLTRAEVVKSTEEGNLYLSEDRLYESGLGRKL